MNGRAIPGYYFDVEKNRYFKIQLSNSAPPGYKYTRSNVKVANRRENKKKQEKAKKARREKLTVKRNAVLQHPVASGIFLSRELAIRPRAQLDHDTALVSGLRPTVTTVQWPLLMDESTLAESHFLPKTNQMLLASSSSYSSRSMIYVCNDWDWSKTNVRLAELQCQLAMNKSIISLTCHQPGFHEIESAYPRWMVCGAQQQVQIGIICANMMSPSVIWQLGKPDESITSACFQRQTGMVAVAGTHGIYTIKFPGDCTNILPLKHEQWPAGIDWIDQNTVAFPSGRNNRSHISLWDMRTKSGTSSRFKLKENVTGMVIPSNSQLAPESGFGAHQLIASTNHHINVFDTRMSRKAEPMLSFSHIHGNPTAALTSNGRALIAAVDRDNMVQVYSTSTGTRIGELAAPYQKSHRSGNAALSKLAWNDGCDAGPTLQAIQENSVVRWRWAGAGTEEG